MNSEFGIVAHPPESNHEDTATQKEDALCARVPLGFEKYERNPRQSA
jgi:hypothetical protein